MTTDRKYPPLGLPTLIAALIGAVMTGALVYGVYTLIAG